jgi:hypothetical protein
MTQLVDKTGPGFWAQIPHLLIALRPPLSSVTGWTYVKLKAIAGAKHEPLPSNERAQARKLGISRSAWHRVKTDLIERGLLVIENGVLVLTDILVVNHMHFSGEISLDDAAVEILRKSKILGPKSGQTLARNRAKTIKNMTTKNNKLSSSLVGTHVGAKQKQNDDDLNPPIPQWIASKFVALSGGTAWKQTRDFPAWLKIKHLPKEFITLGLCYSVGRATGHKLGSLNYALDAITRHAAEMQGFLIDGEPSDDLKRIVARTERRTMQGIRSGKWDLEELLKVS